MFRRIVKSRCLPIAILVIAQLGFVLHAADHGAGQHVHDGVPCLYGAMKDDDVMAPPESVEIPRPLLLFASLPALQRTIESAQCGVFLPPATGPPVIS